MKAIVNELFESLFLGFGIFILLSSFVRPRRDDRKESLRNLTASAIAVIRFAAIVFLVDWCIRFYFEFQSEEDYYSLKTRFFGPFWFGHWVYVISYGIFPQLFWIQRIGQLKVMRVLSALLILFSLHVEKWIILITSLHRDYIPSSWTMAPNYEYLLIYDSVLNLAIFAAVLAGVHYMRMKLRVGQPV
jgi:hypothetical protein